MAVRLCEVKMCEWKGGQRRTPVCDLPGDFTKLTSYRVVSIEASVFVSGSHGVNAILEEPGLLFVALRGEVVLVDSACFCVSGLCIFLVCSTVNQHVYSFVFVQELGNVISVCEKKQMKSMKHWYVVWILRSFSLPGRFAVKSIKLNGIGTISVFAHGVKVNHSNSLSICQFSCQVKLWCTLHQWPMACCLLLRVIEGGALSL